ncbi:MAG: DUF2267 domain-containing protein [Thermodesulfobacteriota bacterium]|jgi:uncharacterized protein (DUF2267 family)|uniref:DUF2267 domain-containing protein n=1 Tax=Alicyclobacillus mali (ex Roth et al. 2021) TaxID=1123961 RepID=UPI0023F44E82|nr:DUF2267 domain-containing protein [Alicyclobacillus mali (ex Roth et al. 2021)]MCL6488874.1 DUF2267 domain-containing protein [Alicyclobacillus mali (ex Roth et al. 2021)]
MSRTGLEVFDATVQKTHEWLKALMEELGWQEDRQRAYLALRAVLHALRDRLPLQEALHLGAQLPMLIRGFYYEGWNPTHLPLKERHTEEFLAHVQHACKREGQIDPRKYAEMARRQGFVVMEDRINPEEVARAVFKVLARHVTAGEIHDVVQSLPIELRELWPAA